MLRKFLAPIHNYFQQFPELLLPSALVCTVTALAVLNAIISITFYKPPQQPLPIPKIQINAEQFLIIQNISPNHGQNILPSEITITFNENVDPHEVEENFSIIPEMKGHFQQGKSPSEVIFKPATQFEPNLTYSVRVESSLQSTTGAKMLAGFTSFFSTKINRPQVQFVSDSIAGRIMSFNSTKENTVKAELTEGIGENISVTMYKSDIGSLLRFLQYTVNEQKQGLSYSYYYDEYINTTIKHSPNSAIQKINTTSQANISVPKETGIYYLEATNNNEAINGSFIVVSDIGVVLRQDDNKVILSAFNPQTGISIEDKLSLQLYNLRDGTRSLLNSDLLGTRSYELPFNQRLDIAVIQKDNDIAVIPVKLQDSQADIRVSKDLEKSYQVFMYTDRPIYRTNDTVYFRGIVRKDRDAVYSLPKLTSLQIKIATQYPDPDKTITVPVDEHGVFNGQLSLKNEQEAYLYLMPQAPNTNEYLGQSSLTIKDYIKPEFEITTTALQSEYVANDKMQYKITGKYFDGSPLANQKVNYSAYQNDYYEVEKKAYGTNFNITSNGGMCGGGYDEDYLGFEYIKQEEVTLDQNGEALISVTANETNNNTSQDITIVASKTDKNSNQINSAAKSIVHAAEFNIFFPPNSNRYQEGETAVVPFYAEKITGESVGNTEFTYTLTVYNSNASEPIITGKTRTNEQGRGEIRIAIPFDSRNSYLALNVYSTDSKGNTAKAQKSLFVYDPNRYTDNWFSNYYADSVNLKISSEKNSYLVGDSIELTVHSNDQVDALLTLERGRIYQPQIVHLQKGENKVVVPASAELSPSITAVFSYFINNKYYTEGISLNVPAMHKLLTVNITTDKNKYNPDEKANLKVTVKNAQSSGVAAQFSLAIVDKAIFALRKSAAPPFHSTMFFSRSRQTNASSSLTWIGQVLGGGQGGGGGGEGGNGAAKDTDTLLWSPNLTTDQNGEYNTTIDLKGISAAWRAQVYAATDETDVGEGSADFIVAK